MLTIDLTFESLHDVSVSRLFGHVGVYTLWASQANDRPTYLGEGRILERLVRHVRRWRADMVGTAAILSECTDRRQAKTHATIAEAFLLELGEMLGRSPTQNDAPGYRKRLETAVVANNVVRLNVRGLHPFLRPEANRARLQERAECSVRLDRDEFLFTTPWNARPGAGGRG